MKRIKLILKIIAIAAIQVTLVLSWTIIYQAFLGLLGISVPFLGLYAWIAGGTAIAILAMYLKVKDGGWISSKDAWIIAIPFAEMFFKLGDRSSKLDEMMNNVKNHLHDNFPNFNYNQKDYKDIDVIVS